MKKCGTSGQDGSVGKHSSPPCTTTAKITTKLQNNYQNCQKIKLYGSLTTKELTKSHLSRQAGGAEAQRLSDMETVEIRNGWSHTHVWRIKMGRDAMGVRDPSPTPEQ